MFDTENKKRYNQEWQKNNREKCRANYYRWYQKNKQKLLAQRKLKKEQRYAQTSHRLIQHHTKYQEINGVDEIILVTDKEHRLIHDSLKKEKLQNGKISMTIVNAAVNRSPNKKKYNNKYRGNYVCLEFEDVLEPNIVLRERIAYNTKNGNVSVVGRFKGKNGKRVYRIRGL